MAHRIALDLGLNIDPYALRGSDCMLGEEAELRRQIYWVLYCTDKLWAAYTGRISTMLVGCGVTWYSCHDSLRVLTSTGLTGHGQPTFGSTSLKCQRPSRNIVPRD